MDLAYNTYNLLKEFYTYEEIQSMPIRSLLSEVEFFRPKFKQIAQQQEQARLQAELEGKKKSAQQMRRNARMNRRSG